MVKEKCTDRQREREGERKKKKKRKTKRSLNIYTYIHVFALYRCVYECIQAHIHINRHTYFSCIYIF